MVLSVNNFIDSINNCTKILLQSMPWMSTIHLVDYNSKNNMVVRYKVNLKYIESIGQNYQDANLQNHKLSASIWYEVLDCLQGRDWVRFWVQRWGNEPMKNQMEPYLGVETPEVCTDTLKLYNLKGKPVYNNLVKWHEKYTQNNNMYSENFTAFMN